MQHNIHPCIWYDGNAKAAAEFYCSLFPGSKITTDTPMVVNFELNGQRFMGLNGGPQFKTNPSISFMVTSETNEEIDELWAKLTEDGMIMMPLDKYPWSDHYGYVQDRFGLAWQLYKGNYSYVNQKITPTFMFVGNQYGNAEAAIRLYNGLFPGSSISSILHYKQEEGEAMAGKVKHAQFILDGNVYMAMDGYGDHKFDFNEAISFVVQCSTQEEIDRYWNTLTANGGAESMCGWLKDPFGVSWQIIPGNLGKLMSTPEKGQAVMQELLKMRKLDKAVLEKAAGL
jgi:predicted 3-demethylubiquinone-9 3-methyltransferase (glyoxalase superfamily)